MIDFRCSDVKGKDEEDIDDANLIENLQKHADEEKLSIKVTGGLLDCYIFVPKLKKIRRSISQ